MASPEFNLANSADAKIKAPCTCIELARESKWHSPLWGFPQQLVQLLKSLSFFSPPEELWHVATFSFERFQQAIDQIIIIVVVYVYKDESMVSNKRNLPGESGQSSLNSWETPLLPAFHEKVIKIIRQYHRQHYYAICIAMHIIIITTKIIATIYNHNNTNLLWGEDRKRQSQPVPPFHWRVPS